PEEIFVLDFLLSLRGFGICLTLFMLALFGGLYVVPINTLMQYESPKVYLATVIGCNNILNALGMAGVSVIAVLLLTVGFTVPDLFLFVGVASIFISIYICMTLPDALLRSLFQFVLSTCFRVRIQGLDEFKKASKCTIIVANHTSLLDALLLASYLPEKLTFAINSEWRKKWFIKVFSSLINLYPIDPTNPMAVRGLIEEAKKGKKMVIFPEGRITVTGGLMKIYEGAAVVADKAQACLLPIRINGAHISKLSYMSKKTKTFAFPQITLTILPSRKFDVDPQIKGKTRRAVLSRHLYDLMSGMMYKTSDINKNIFVDLLASQKLYGKEHIIAEDINRKPITYKKLLLKSYVLGEAYKASFKEDKVGIMLPNTLACLVSFYALLAVDKTPVMMNFSHGTVQISSCATTVGLKTVITSKAFIEQGHLEKQEAALKEAGVQIVYLEDFAKTISFKAKLSGMWAFGNKRLPTNTASSTSVVLFTSGSEGLPKAVFLSHKNLQANRYQLTSVLALNASDVFLNALPMFHSFGLSIGGIVSVLSGVKTFYYPSPLHYRIVPELFYDTNANIICGTDTFLYGYGRRANPYDFYNMKYAIVGGEKLKEQTSSLWFSKFGVRILEGYGATETSPVIALNTPMYLKQGTVGRLLPNEEYILEKVPGIDEGGRLIIKGDNVMQGYMRPEKPLVLEPPKDNWYDTGDIVKIDEEGFVQITGRAKRFAKIAGEMVSLSAVEQIIDKMYPSATQGIVAIPDERRGEQLVLITNVKDIKPSALREAFKLNGTSELWAPRQVIYMQKPPLLGTGKFDYITAKSLIK
ncbi:MAG: AMP-binding protein, partial [Alphaproteobacteria bacterium]